MLCGGGSVMQYAREGHQVPIGMTMLAHSTACELFGLDYTRVSSCGAVVTGDLTCRERRGVRTRADATATGAPTSAHQSICCRDWNSQCVLCLVEITTCV